MKKEKKINRKQALKRMGKYAGLTALGTFILLNTEKQAHLLGSRDWFLNYILNKSLNSTTRFISNILFDKEINLVSFLIMISFGIALLKLVVPLCYSLYYKLKQRGYQKLSMVN